MRLDFPATLPLFPLTEAVLFPHLPLPLHVSNPRHRRMVLDVLGGNATMAVSLTRPGAGAAEGGREAVFAIGCAARLERCEPLEDECFDIVLRGLTRLRILGEEGEDPYRVVQVEVLSDAQSDPALLEEARRRALAAIAQAPDGPAILVIEPQLSHDLFVNALSQSLPLSVLEKQSLLECHSIASRYGRLLEVLEFKRLETALGFKGDGWLH